MNKSESITKIASALVKAQAVMGNAIKDSKNPFFKSNFADLNSVREACIPALNANGISVLQPTVNENGKAFVETVLLHESGEFISSLTEVLCAKQNDPQAHGSGISYARRYGLQSLVNLGSADDDGEQAMGRQTFTPPPKRELPQEVPKSSSKPVTANVPEPKKTVSFKKSTPTPAVEAVEEIDL